MVDGGIGNLVSLCAFATCAWFKCELFRWSLQRCFISESLFVSSQFFFRLHWPSLAQLPPFAVDINNKRMAESMASVYMYNFHANTVVYKIIFLFQLGKSRIGMQATANRFNCMSVLLSVLCPSVQLLSAHLAIHFNSGFSTMGTLWHFH